jgi:hypothetical protein
MKHLAVMILILTGCFNPLLQAAGDNYPFGGRAAGMGNAMVAVYDFWAVSHNQACLAQISSPAAGCYFENRFLSREMGFGAAAFALPAGGGVFGLSLTCFGYSLYKESKVGLAYARPFGDKLSAGVQLDYLFTFIGEGYGSAGALAAEMGVLYELLPGFQLGVHVLNPTLATLKDFGGERLSTIFRLGMAYHCSERVLLSLETEKDMDSKPVLRCGLEYGITDNVFLRAGAGTQPTTNSFGFGICLGKLRIDLASSFHYVLGYSPQASLVYSFR